MDKLKIQATGFPLTTETLKFMRDTYEILYGAFGNAVHPNDNIILYGMEPTGGNIKDGYAVIKGEVLPFIGGTNTGTIILKEEVVDAAYNDNLQDPSQITNYPTYFTRYLTTGNPGEGVADWPFSTFKRLKSLIDISDAVEQATTTRKGIIELATQSEVNNGTDNQRAVTPTTLANRTATETRKGVIEIATQSEVDAGTDDSRAVTPAKLAALNYGKVIASGTFSKSGSGTDGQDFTIIFNEYISLLGATTNRDNRYSVIVMVDSITSTDPGIEGHETVRLQATDKTSTQSPPVYGFYIKGQFEFLVPNTVSGSGTVTISYMVIEWP